MRTVSSGGAVLLTTLVSAFAPRAQEATSRALERTVPTLPPSCCFDDAELTVTR